MSNTSIQNCILTFDMNSSKRFKILMDSGKTVFTAQDLRMLWQENALNAKTNAVRMTQKGTIVHIAKGYYALNDRYNEYELANRIISPSYVSFQSALLHAGVSFQARSQIDSAAGLTYRKKIGTRTFVYYALKDELLFNLDGIRTKDGVSMASPERAILDCLYLGFLPDIDNKEKINALVFKRLSAMYPKTVQKKAGKIL